MFFEDKSKQKKKLVVVFVGLLLLIGLLFLPQYGPIWRIVVTSTPTSVLVQVPTETATKVPTFTSTPTPTVTPTDFNKFKLIECNTSIFRLFEF